ncbi:hypothetical protein [Rhizobium leguminosarum]|uniref:hypothetical protein n=1 Tax=Rhizobium leguminosarum TaxID=384 RepID=UPI001C962C10|nr:hypothetical protein [Rhizobium leguminosarum]MBY5563594.1 hypothetical protein [Rhizobium leguminosarum]MBY5709674.1 hypothetical protein [Rhizobium leguminosarum]
MTTRITFARKNTDGQIWEAPPRLHAPANDNFRPIATGCGDEFEFIDRGKAWYSSNFCRDQHANDRRDWPLEKLLNTEQNDHCLRLARRYRHLHDVATLPTELIGTDAADNVYIVHKEDAEGKPKEIKVVTGKRANVDTAPTRAAAMTSETKRRAALVPKKWQGDMPLLAKIDAGRELAYLRARLAVTDNIISAFEMAVLDGDTLEAIGRALGAGSKGAKGAARAWVFDGFQIVDRFWQRRAA